MYIVKYIKQKNYKSIIIYISTLMAAGITGILIFPYSITHIFFGYRGQEVSHNLFDFSILITSIEENFILINNEIFNGYGYIVIIFAVILCVLWLLTKNKQTRSK